MELIQQQDWIQKECCTAFVSRIKYSSCMMVKDTDTQKIQIPYTLLVGTSLTSSRQQELRPRDVNLLTILFCAHKAHNNNDNIDAAIKRSKDSKHHLTRSVSKLPANRSHTASTMRLAVLYALVQSSLVRCFVVNSASTPPLYTQQSPPLSSSAWSQHKHRNSINQLVSMRGGAVSTATTSTARQLAINPAILSVVAGSLAGAIGVGVSFPLDTLKTKAQVLRSAAAINDSNDMSSSSMLTSARPSLDGSAAASRPESLGMLKMFGLIWEREGLSGFFSGVKGAMFGQAIIKALAFSANSNTITLLKASELTRDLPSAAILLLASCFAGFITSFVVVPIERVKINMQADPTRYKHEIDCLRTIIVNEGFGNLMSRGLGATLLREIPSYGLYFWVYGLMSQSTAAQLLPTSIIPLICGALSGMASWLPVYPVDVVKTVLQNGDNKESTWAATRKIYDEGGIAAFFDGLDAKMLRAGVNHAVTFFVYDYIMSSFAV
jgi:Mitochondrial carrier protein